jgi:hypothetical protein
MNLKELMLNYLREEGFCPKEEKYGLSFKCEGLNFIFFYDEDDDQYFRLMMPGIFDVTEENFPAVLLALNKVNSEIKVVKAYTPVQDEVWLGFEVIVDSTPVLADFVPRGIAMLRAAQRKFYEAIQQG